MSDERRFTTENDTPCPFRLARMGYAMLGEFRAPKRGELYIIPSAGPDLTEDEPLVVGATEDLETPRHIVREATAEEKRIGELGPLGALLDMLGFDVGDEEVSD